MTFSGQMCRALLSTLLSNQVGGSSVEGVNPPLGPLRFEWLWLKGAS